MGLVHFIGNVAEQIIWTVAFEKWYETNKSIYQWKSKKINRPTGGGISIDKYEDLPC